jgi:4-azaleucine resistance transporter AzlC
VAVGSHARSLRAIAPIAFAVATFGASFGVLARASHMGRLAPIVMSATTFAGSAQFAAASILKQGGGLAAAVAAAVLLNTRYVAIGISVASLFRGPSWRRLAESQLVVDESWALSSRGDGTFDRRLLIAYGGVLYLAWNIGTAIGALAGGAIGNPNRLGLDAAFPALFFALLLPQLRGSRAVVAAVLGGGVALALVPFAPPGVPIVVAAAACLVGIRR